MSRAIVDRIGQIEFALAIVVADPLQDRQRRACRRAPSARRCRARWRARSRWRRRPRGWRSARRLASSAGRSRSDRPAESPAPRPPRPRPARARSRASVCGRISGVSPKTTRISSAPCAIAAFAASTACAVPRRSRLHENLRRPAANARGLGRDRRRGPGPTTTAVAVPPAARTAASTWASSERPATACSTFGRAERMRVPSPAASTIARQVRAAHCDSVRFAAVIAERCARKGAAVSASEFC